MTILADSDEAAAAAFIARSEDRMHDLDRMVNALMHSDDPAHHAVPRAMLYRYVKRIIANVSSVVGTLIRNLDRSDVDD